jgi:hypothetical protein
VCITKRIAALEVLVAGLQSQLAATKDESAISSRLAQAAIHGAVDRRVAVIADQSQFSRRDPLRQL